MKKYLLIIIGSSFSLFSAAQTTLRGQVTETGTHRPLTGVSIVIQESTAGTITDTTGRFSLKTGLTNLTLIISHVGFKPENIKIKSPFSALIEISLQPQNTALQEVVVSTGYQTLPKERATGSFTQVSNAQLNRKVSTDILSRLQDAVPGLIFNQIINGHTVNSSITIRGVSTINGNAEPLIIVDNFPYDQDITNINPNDVESITVLKDAAAASIWGSRAGNGVIVITTKKGKYNQAPKVNFNSNITFGAKPNQFYLPQMTSVDYIEIEKKLFASGYYSAAETSINKTPLSPVIELLIAKRDGTMPAGTVDAQIEALKNNDVRNDYNKYFNRVAVNQQNALSVSGGSSNQKYFVSAGYDHNLQNLVGNQYQRVTLNASNTYNLFNNKLELTTSIYYTGSNTQDNNPGTGNLGLSYQNLYPYAHLADANGNPLTIARDYRLSFAQAAQQQGLLNWSYQPLAEIGLANNHTVVTDYRINTGLTYHIIPGLNAQLLYQYGHTVNDFRNLNSQDTYYTRNQINNLTAVGSNGILTRPIPLGGILDLTTGDLINQDVRGQLNYTKDWKKNSLTAIAGAEVSDSHNTANSYRLYGYDDDHATSQAINYTSTFPRYVSSQANSVAIPNNESESDLTDRFVSYYANAGYTYDNRYTLSGSLRFDQSNLFGVNTNQKGVPLYSVGLGWNISQESFYKSSWLPYLKLRATYGYNGNIDKNLSAYTTALYNSGSSALTLQPYATVQNPPNPELRWERDNIKNLGLDFATKNNIISGTIEYYRKTGLDLIGTTPFPPSSGISTFTGNFANTFGHGLDLTINSRNIDQQFKWLTAFFISFTADKVTNYAAASLTPGSSIVDNGSYIPVVGQPLYSIYSYQWAGLNPQTGDPQGYLNGQASNNYSAIRAAATKDNIVYNGSARPTVFGAFTNTFTYKNISLSANISYRLGYYFRRHSIMYGTDNGLSSQHGDYEKRWQKPGDEAFTQVPSVPASPNSLRDYFYTWSSVLVDKADNIRLQDINLNYTFLKSKLHWLPFDSAQMYVYANNICLLWKASKSSLDPDYINGPPPSRTIAFGLKAGF
ncbi:TonB-linked outer membrane protein, SusC/RagA family [Mucilaginibacter pineti]|uniref:TonB-linked outer membrane protein, SusC/RagA family n=1 Tax=Mucilaginibacter pineti TaxID=1391627 RepID=A0A1G7P3R8_9SPHI|nr:SusC/RagA family TonB-linked outer membrane protein [Mucilaginibacter pineti]SDF80946.1 TonB-linked outer membrane protein, SusC/RagA family [Mucilaginibacter pineti]